MPPPQAALQHTVLVRRLPSPSCVLARIPARRWTQRPDHAPSTWLELGRDAGGHQALGPASIRTPPVPVNGRPLPDREIGLRRLLATFVSRSGQSGGDLRENLLAAEGSRPRGVRIASG
jgi:hypothetical protein